MTKKTSISKPSRRKRSWREKLADCKDFPKVSVIDDKLSKRWGAGTCVIPAPLEVDAAMKKVTRGKLTTIDALRKALAKKHGATITCPITTGIFAWISAHAAHEAESEGARRITPYWRTLKSGGELNPKYPGGVKNLCARLAAEGHKVIQRGKRFVVVDFERAVVEPKL
jgi:hypothetical protein